MTPIVNLSISPSSAFESESTVVTFDFTVEGDIPEGGLFVFTDSDTTSSLNDFDLFEITTSGGEFPLGDFDFTGFGFNITSPTASVSLPAIEDGLDEGAETITYQILTADEVDADDLAAVGGVVDEYEVGSGTASVTINDTPEEGEAPEEETPEEPVDEVPEEEAPEEPVDEVPEEETPEEPVDEVPEEAPEEEAPEEPVDEVPEEEAPEEEAPEEPVEEEPVDEVPEEETPEEPVDEAPEEEAPEEPVDEVPEEETPEEPVDEVPEEEAPEEEAPEEPVDEVPEEDVDVDVSFEPAFGTIDSDILEVEGSGQLLFAGDLNDLVDATTGDGGNRLYAGSGDDVLVLGESDRAFGGAGDDLFFATSGGDNTITGGDGADQFWVATAEIPDAINTVTDFTSGEDVIGLAGLGIGFEDVSLTQDGADALIGALGSDLAIFEDVDIASLSTDDFAFG